jgi:hypothetical protein
MLHCNRRVLCLVLASFGLVLSSLSVHAQTDHRGRKYQAPPPASRISVTVLRASNGKPIEHAAVIFHPIEGDKDKGSLELKTNEDGKVLIDVIPVGDTVRMQVIANGYQTYGHDYKIDKDEMSMEVRMSRPVADYSIYKNNNTAKDNGNGSNSGSGNSSDGDKQQNPPAQNQQQPK